VRNEIRVPREVDLAEKRREKEDEKDIWRRNLRRKVTWRGFGRAGAGVRKSVVPKFRPRRQRWRVNGAVAIVAFGYGETEAEIYERL